LWQFSNISVYNWKKAKEYKFIDIDELCIEAFNIDVVIDNLDKLELKLKS